MSFENSVRECIFWLQSFEFSIWILRFYAQKLILSSYVHERKIKHSNGKFEKVLTEINKNVYLACLLPEFITLYNLSFDILNLSLWYFITTRIGGFFHAVRRQNFLHTTPQLYLTVRKKKIITMNNCIRNVALYSWLIKWNMNIRIGNMNICYSYLETKSFYKDGEKN